MKTLVFTIVITDRFKRLAEYTHPTIKAYADKIGADFKVVNKTVCSSPHWEKFVVYDFLDEYDRVIFFDTDAIVRDTCPNLFDIVPEDRIGMFYEIPYKFSEKEEWGSQISASMIELGVNVDWRDIKYYNSGVFVVSKCHKYLFIRPQEELNHLWEQGYLNAILNKELIIKPDLMYDLPVEYNRMGYIDRIGIDKRECYIIHYAGLLRAIKLVNLVRIIKEDLETWKKS